MKMKANTKIFLMFIVGIFVYLGFFALIIPTAAEGNTYKNTTVIAGYDHDGAIIARDESGNLWAFDSEDSWDIGEIVVLTMNDRNTENIEDDEIIEIYRCQMSEMVDLSN